MGAYDDGTGPRILRERGAGTLKDRADRPSIDYEAAQVLDAYARGFSYQADGDGVDREQMEEAVRDAVEEFFATDAWDFVPAGETGEVTRDYLVATTTEAVLAGELTVTDRIAYDPVTR